MLLDAFPMDTWPLRKNYIGADGASPTGVKGSLTVVWSR